MSISVELETLKEDSSRQTIERRKALEEKLAGLTEQGDSMEARWRLEKDLIDAISETKEAIEGTMHQVEEVRASRRPGSSGRTQIRDPAGTREESGSVRSASCGYPSERGSAEGGGRCRGYRCGGLSMDPHTGIETGRRRDGKIAAYGGSTGSAGHPSGKMPSRRYPMPSGAHERESAIPTDPWVPLCFWGQQESGKPSWSKHWPTFFSMTRQP